eukprot:TRINITY_DN13662_c0_g1_i1.p1 TRINITY_DN13662_c0_g1~~TRINITY_DN13662_c0_g1_i1.p1  ORF type:complete len:162 (-),score=17.90 TRINITY_DN13662_c0_g1_i1:15-500(-)
MMSLDNPDPLQNRFRAESSQSRAPLESDDKFGITPDEIYEYIRDIKDPEHPYTLEQLNVVSDDKIQIVDDGGGNMLIRIEFTPTVPHCSLAAIIGLCLREKLIRELIVPFKLHIFITPGSHDTELEINKQVNDKERVAAAMENPNLRRMVDTNISYEKQDL